MKNKYLKLFIIISLLFVVTGCVHVNRDSYEVITDSILNSNIKTYNHYDKGYKHYVPRGLTVTYQNKLNEVIKSNKYEYYLYVDLVSYYNKTELTYNTQDDIYYSSLIRDNKGVINITKRDDGFE